MPALALAQSTGVTPGMWEMAITIDSINAPNAPPAVAKMMQGRTTRVRHCITPEEASRGPQEMLKSAKSCTFQKYQMRGGRLDSEMTCSSGGQTTRMVSTGAFTPTSFATQGKAVATGPMPMTMTSHATGKLIGACKK